LESQGYDGIVLKETRADYGISDTQFVSFSPEQIKSATGNAGTYGNENPSILFQDDADTEGVAQETERINEQVNTELTEFETGKLPANHIFHLGRPGEILRNTGFPDQPIEMAARQLTKKIEGHQFKPTEILNIVNGLLEPVAVFAYGDSAKSQNVIVDFQKDGKNFLVGVHFNQERHGTIVSDIRTIFNKENEEWLNWINQGKLLYADIKKLQAVAAQQRINPAEVDYLDLESINNLIQQNEGVKDYYPADPSTLFQLTDDEIREEALRYPSPQAWREAAEDDVIFGLDPVFPEGMSGAEAEAWFTAKWEEAQGIRRDEAGKVLEEAPVLTSNEIDRRLLETWADEAGLVKWLKAIHTARQEDPYSGQAVDEADAAVREEEGALRARINREVHPSILMAAQRVSRGRQLDPKVRKQVMTLLERGIGYYRDLYVEITGDPEFAAYARNEIEVDRYVEAVRGKDLSVAQKQRLAKELRDEDIQKKYEAGQLSDEDMEQYIETLREKGKGLESKLRAAEAALAENDARLREDERAYYRLRQEIARDEETLANYEKEIVSLEEALAKQKALNKEERSKARDGKIRKYEDRIGSLMYKERALREALASAREEARKGTATVKADAALAASMAVGRAKAEAARNEKERRAAKRLLEDRRRRVERLLKKPGPGILLEKKYKIMALQAAFLAGVNPVNKGKKVQWDKDEKAIPVAEFRQKVLNGEIDTGILDKRLLDRVFRRDLNELFDSDLDALITEIESLEAEGRAAWKEIEARRVHEAASAIARIGEEQNRLRAEGKTKAAKRYIKYLAAKTTEEQKKIADSADSKFTKMLWEGWKDANLFRHMDGEAEGVIYELFRKDGNAAKRQKYQQMDRRIGEIIQAAGKAGMMDKDGNVSAALRQKKVLVEGLGPGGITQTMTVPEMMLAEVALKNEKMKAAMLYGNFLSADEKWDFQKRMKEAGWLDDAERKKAVKKAKREAKERGGKYQPPMKANTERDAIWEEIHQAGARKETLLKKALAENLTDKERGVAQAIVDNFGDNFDRIKDVFFEMFNQDVGSQDFYLPMIHTTATGEKTGHEEMAEALNIGTAKVNISVDKGMLLDRQDIPPWGQTPIELDIFKVFFKGVEREEHFAAFAPYIRKLNAIFKQGNHGAGALQEKLTVMYGKFAMERLRNHINVLAAPESVRRDTAERMLDGLSGKAAMAEIGFNVASYLAQYPQSIAGFGGHVRPGEMLGAIVDYLKNPRLFDETVREKSTVMRRRVINYAQEYYNKMKESGKFTAAQLRIAKAAMKMQEIADTQTVSIGWWAVYQKEVKANGGNEEAAIARADEVVLDTQPTMDETELSPIFSGRSGLPKALVRYGAPLNVVWNQLSYPIASMISGGIPNAIKNGTLQRLVGVYTAFGIANALVALMRGKFGDDDDDLEDKIRLLAYYVIASPIAESVPLVSNFTGPLATQAFTGKREWVLPQRPMPMAELGLQAGQEWIAGANEENRKKREALLKKALRDTIFTGMYGTGLPVNQVRKILTAKDEGSFWPVIGFRRGN
jgi:hypothetical protein